MAGQAMRPFVLWAPNLFDNSALTLRSRERRQDEGSKKFQTDRQRICAAICALKASKGSSATRNQSCSFFQ